MNHDYKSKMSEEFILKAFRSFRRCIGSITEKMVAILNKLLFCCLVFKIKINLVL